MFNRKNRSRKMKKIFQWEEYLNWKNMSKEQKLNFKRACLFPFLVYIVYVFLNQYSLAILLLLGLYFLIRFKNRNKLGRLIFFYFDLFRFVLKLSSFSK